MDGQTTDAAPRRDREWTKRVWDSCKAGLIEDTALDILDADTLDDVIEHITLLWDTIELYLENRARAEQEDVEA